MAYPNYYGLPKRGIPLRGLPGRGLPGGTDVAPIVEIPPGVDAPIYSYSGRGGVITRKENRRDRLRREDEEILLILMNTIINQLDN